MILGSQIQFGALIAMSMSRNNDYSQRRGRATRQFDAPHCQAGAAPAYGHRQRRRVAAGPSPRRKQCSVGLSSPSIWPTRLEPEGARSGAGAGDPERRRAAPGQRPAAAAGDLHGIRAGRFRRGAGETRRRPRSTTSPRKSPCPRSASPPSCSAAASITNCCRDAAEWRADLIVVGSHRPVMSDYLLGSNAKTIVRHAQCSVLVVRV